MNNEAAVDPQEAEPMDAIMEQHNAQHEAPEGNDQEQDARGERTMIPLSVAQKLRQQKRELELELQWERQRNSQNSPQAPQQEDTSRYESATREDLVKMQEQSIRIADERSWARQNPEKIEYVNENLQKFLKQRPHLAAAIDLAPNRYEEAFELMDKLSPKQKQLMKEPPKPVKKEAPNAPGSVPKAAALNEAIDYMKMSDAEFNAWRQEKRSRR